MALDTETERGRLTGAVRYNAVVQSRVLHLKRRVPRKSQGIRASPLQDKVIV